MTIVGKKTSETPMSHVSILWERSPSRHQGVRTVRVFKTKLMSHFGEFNLIPKKIN
jgi:hypothetical protein